MRYLICLILVVAGAHLAACVDQPGADNSGASQNGAAAAATPEAYGPIARNFEGETIEVRPLDDPANPYLGQYSESDRWCYDNFIIEVNYERLGEPGVSQGQLEVTDDDFLVPESVRQRTSLAHRQGAEVDATHFSKGFQLVAEGVMSDDLREAKLLKWAQLNAEYMPLIPQWLAEQPPKWAIFLPDGSIVTYGELGSGRDFFPKDGHWRLDDPSVTCHYSADGEMVDELAAPHLWVEMFFPDFEQALQKHHVTRDDVQTYDRYVVFQNLQDYSLTGHYLYDGTPVSDEDWDKLRDANRYFEMYGKYIQPMYDWQEGMAQ